MSNLTKIAFGIGGVGAVGGGIGYGLYSFSNKEEKSTLKYKLTSEGFDINVTEEEWTAIESAHKGSKNKFDIPESATNKKEWLKKHCNGILEKEDKLNSNYGKAIQWCVKKEKIADILKKENSKLRTLNLGDPIEETEKTLWKEKIANLKLPANNEAKLALKVTFNPPTVADDAQIKEIQKQCKSVIETETIGEDFANKLTLAKEWCSNAK